MDKLFKGYEKWLAHNFPNSTSDQQLKGVMEELGELAHADLKMEQGIRGMKNEDLEDAVGDILIYLTGYCIRKNIRFMEIYEGIDKEYCPLVSSDYLLKITMKRFGALCYFDILGITLNEIIESLVQVLAQYCVKCNIDMTKCFKDAWDNIKDRDWIKYQFNGRDK